MKITYTVMPTGGPVRSIGGDGASATRRAVKITLKNLKRWYARLRHGTAAPAFKDNRQNHLQDIKISCEGNIMMIIDQEESRNRTNENLENELRESLANSEQSKTVPSAMTMTADINLTTVNGLTKGGESLVRDLSSRDHHRSSSRRN